PEETSVERRDVDHPFPNRDAAIDLVAAGVAIDLAVALRIESPDLLACRRLDRVDAARRARRVEHAVDDDRRRLEAAARAHLVFPCEAEPMHVVPIDLIERRVMALAEIASVRHPLLGLAVGVEKPLARDVPVALLGGRNAR